MKIHQMLRDKLRRWRRAWHRRQQVRRLAADVSVLSGRADFEVAPDELVVLTLVRDGEIYVRTFLDHYRQLGVRHMVFLDNGSRDQTISLLSGHEDVTLLATKLPYAEYKHIFKQYLVRRFSQGRWILLVDIDELFEYPGSDKIGLAALLAYLDEQGATAVLAHMLDMFSDQPLSSINTTVESDLRQQYQHYDLSDLNQRSYSQFMEDDGVVNDVVAPDIELPVFDGGVRGQTFDQYLLMAKHPLVKDDGKLHPFPNSHGVDHAHLADLSCVLRHYKLTSRLKEQASRAIEEGQYYKDSLEYKKYHSVLEEQPDLELPESSAKRYAGVDQLVAEGFCVVSDRYRDYVSQHAAADQPQPASPNPPADDANP